MLAVPGCWHALVVTAIFAGLRASELRGLRWQDVDFTVKAIEVRQRADRFNKIGPFKSAAAAREIPMGPYLANTLREWKLVCPGVRSISSSPTARATSRPCCDPLSRARSSRT
jgi:integrase